MDKLLQPDTGLLVWTVITFVSLVLILKSVAWKPLLAALADRENRIKNDLENAKKARADAERIRGDIESQLAGFGAKGREMMDQASKQAESLRAQIKAAAEADSQRLRDKTMAELSDEKEKLVRDLRREVGSLSVMAAERLLKKSVDGNVQKTVLDDFYKDLEGKKIEA